MKGQSIVSLLVSFAVLNTGLVTRQISATATPAPIFRPVIRNIQNQLPRNLVFRLPSSLPATITKNEADLVKGSKPSSGRQTTNKQTRNAEASLVTAIRNAVGFEKREFFAQMEYFFTKVDLNNDGNKEVIVYTVGTLCGAWECPVYIFTKSGTGYRWIGTIVSQSNEAQIAVLSTRSKGWLDIATLVYDPQQRRGNWKLNKFNGTTYENTYQNLSSMPGQVVLRPKGSGISLAQPGI
jgi:hypothetical protein